jgi:aspartate kinase
MEQNAITGMSIDENCIMVTIINLPYSTKIISEIFTNLAEKKINIDMISQTPPHLDKTNISFTAPNKNLIEISNILEEITNDFETSNYNINSNLIKLSVVGIGMISTPGIAASIFNLLSINNIEFYQVTTSEISISYTINKKDKNEAITLITDKFNL